MTDTLLAAMLGAIGVIGVALIGAAATVAGLFWRRMLRAEANNVNLWTYTRLLIDHIYVGGIGPPPAPPDHIKHLYQSGE